MIEKIKGNIYYIILILILFSIDRLVKISVINKMEEGDSFLVIKDFFSITYIRNSGAAFGSFQEKTIFLSILTIVISIFIFNMMIKSDIIFQKLALSMIFAGALGNIYDRLKYGYVIDMFDFHGIWKFIFNFADICVVLGTGLMVIYLYFGNEKL